MKPPPKSSTESFLPAPYPPFAHYFVSDLGRVWNSRWGRFIAGPHESRRRFLTLYSGIKKTKRLLLSVLVLETFKGPRPPGKNALHWDDNPQNNALRNLRWGTQGENVRDAFRNGGPKIFKDSEIRTMRRLSENGWSQTRLAAHFKISIGAMSKIIRHKNYSSVK